jgi:hypothetical protein
MGAQAGLLPYSSLPPHQSPLPESGQLLLNVLCVSLRLPFALAVLACTTETPTQRTVFQGSVGAATCNGDLKTESQPLD